VKSVENFFLGTEPCFNYQIYCNIQAGYPSLSSRRSPGDWTGGRFGRILSNKSDQVFALAFYSSPEPPWNIESQVAVKVAA